MVEHTKAIQDKFAEIAAKLSNLDSFFDDIPGARIGVPETKKIDYIETDSTLTPELAAFLTGIDDSASKSAPTTPTAASQPFSSSDYAIPTSPDTTPEILVDEEPPAPPAASGILFYLLVLPSFLFTFSLTDANYIYASFSHSLLSLFPTNKT